MLSIGLPCIWKNLNFYGTYRNTNSSTEIGSIVDFLGKGRMNMEIWTDNLQVFIDISNFSGLDGYNHVKNRMYPCGDRNVPVPVIIGLNLLRPFI